MDCLLLLIALHFMAQFRVLLPDVQYKHLGACMSVLGDFHDEKSMYVRRWIRTLIACCRIWFSHFVWRNMLSKVVWFPGCWRAVCTKKLAAQEVGAAAAPPRHGIDAFPVVLRSDLSWSWLHCPFLSYEKCCRPGSSWLYHRIGLRCVNTLSRGT